MAVATSEASAASRRDWRTTPQAPRNRVGRALWSLVWLLLFRPTPRMRLFDAWRRLLLRLFGGRIARTAVLYPSARIWAPWNLEMEEHSVLSERCECYCVDRVTLGDHANVGPEAFLCAATRDIALLSKPLVTKPITLGPHSWVCTRAFVGPGVTIGAGAVVGACAVVTRDVAEWTVVAGNPARLLRARELREPHPS
jgi:putative colanic acid biosynthesis acetyltransferase WcaF